MAGRVGYPNPILTQASTAVSGLSAYTFHTGTGAGGGGSAGTAAAPASSRASAAPSTVGGRQPRRDRTKPARNPPAGLDPSSPVCRPRGGHGLQPAGLELPWGAVAVDAPTYVAYGARPMAGRSSQAGALAGRPPTAGAHRREAARRWRRMRGRRPGDSPDPCMLLPCRKLPTALHDGYTT